MPFGGLELLGVVADAANFTSNACLLYVNKGVSWCLNDKTAVHSPSWVPKIDLDCLSLAKVNFGLCCSYNMRLESGMDSFPYQILFDFILESLLLLLLPNISNGPQPDRS